MSFIYRIASKAAGRIQILLAIQRLPCLKYSDVDI